MGLDFWAPLSTSAFSLLSRHSEATEDQHLAFRLRPSLSDGSFYTASEAPKDENQQHVASRCRCVASGKGQRNPCKMRLVAVLPIFQTSIYPISTRTSFSFFILETGMRLPSIGRPLSVIFLTPFWTPARLTTLMASVLFRNRR